MSRGCKNKCVLIGTVISKPEYIFNKDKKKFFRFYLSINRRKDKKDIIPVMFSKSEYSIDRIIKGENFKIEGTFVSYLRKGRKYLYVIANNINSSKSFDRNNICIAGYICGIHNSEITKSGFKKLNVTIAVNNNGSKSYIPCVFFNGNISYVENLNEGDFIHINGYINSKIMNNNKVCEVSAFKVCNH